MNPIQAVIFDLDGLMVNSEPLSYRAWQQVLADFGTTLNEQDYRQVIGMDGDSTIDTLRKWMALPASNEELLDLHYLHWIAIVREEIQPMEGLMDLVETFQEWDLKLAVASNSRSDYVNCVLETLGLKGNFNYVVAADQVDQGKPAPDLYEAAAAGLSVETQYCLALEDSPTGLKSALNAGIRCVVVPNSSLLDASFEGAFAIFPSLSDLITNLDWLLS